MQIKNISIINTSIINTSTKNIFKIIIINILAITLGNCASPRQGIYTQNNAATEISQAQSQATPSPSPQSLVFAQPIQKPEYETPIGPPEPFGPPVSVNPPVNPPVNPTIGQPGPLAPQNATNFVYGPLPVATYPIMLVLGPGKARGLAYVGVLRALSEAKIPIAAILGTEIGGLIGGIYAMDGNINHLEWALLRLKDEALVRGNIDDGLEKILPNHPDLKQVKIPLLVQSGNSILDSGDMINALGSLLQAPINTGHPFLIEEARKLGAGPVVVVDVNNSLINNPPLNADLIIRPDMRGIMEDNFSKRTEIAFRGKVATASKIDEIKRLVGLSQ